ncbi:zinc ribbon domain-containing protein [Sulfuracidifex tepidarius]|uniref:Zinc-ribbon domain-containing protein n=1 Tax=Sulfuracidifex tepidarius TaxID=1294262 RepID=A0A510E0N2_9CREN|nr:zinc ribbon domain-containing protein [Sulfuracidifex tepidarius]BBG25997.1 hypothetical protein IC007_0502 [Sulfuracidifex tepidarius]
MTKFCPKCGTPNPDEAQFCSKCGAPLPNLTLPASPPAPMGGMPPSYPPQYPATSFNMTKLNDYNKRYFSLVGGILTGLAFIIFAITFVLLLAYPFTISGGTGNLAGFYGVMIGTFAMYLVLGIFVFLIGIKRSITPSLTFITGLLVFLYFILFGVGMFLLQSESDGLFQTNSNGVELVLGSVFVLITLILGRSFSPINKILAYSFMLVGVILAYAGVGGLTNSYVSSTSSVYVIQPSAIFFISSLAIVSGIILPIALMIDVFMSKFPMGKTIFSIMLDVILLIFSIGQIILGSTIISAGIPSTTGLPGIISASLYMSYTAGVLDLIAGIFVLLSSVLLMVNNIVTISKQAGRPSGYYSPPPPPRY